MGISDEQPPLAATGWRVFRLVASVFPPVSIFDSVASAEDLQSVYELEALTNDRIRVEVGDLDLVPAEERVVGPGATPIMAAFTHINPEGSRFCSPAFGAYYAALEIETAVAETVYHREQMLAASAETAGKPIDVDMRCYVAELSGDLHDARPWSDDHPEILDPGSYSASQALGVALRSGGSNGIIYPSVRLTDGTCIAVFRPKCLANCVQERHLTYQWDGERISNIYEKRAFSV